MSLDAALKAFALSEMSVTGRPLLLANWQNNSKNEETDRSLHNSKCTARVEQQVKRQT